MLSERSKALGANGSFRGRFADAIAPKEKRKSGGKREAREGGGERGSPGRNGKEGAETA